jgi:outer membrane protein OmpA-like peptidoglycan-associated protein
MNYIIRDIITSGVSSICPMFLLWFKKRNKLLVLKCCYFPRSRHSPGTNSMKMKTITCICGLLLGTTLFAQQTATLDVRVLNMKGQPYKGDKILFVGQESHQTFSGITNAAGKFEMHLPAGDVYDIRIQSIGEEVEYNTLEIPAIGEGEELERAELVITYEAPKSYTLSNLQFESGKSAIKPVSYPLLDDLAEIMALKPELKIEVAGHTDSDGDDAANLALSRQRADAVKNYLVKKGIAASRIVAHGYGESRPVADNATAAGKQRNRRTEVKIL